MARRGNQDLERRRDFDPALAWLLGAALLLLALPSLALERDGDRFVDEQHHAVALVWAFGLTDAVELPAYRECGFNTVYLDLPAAAGVDPQGLLRLADSAGRQGFHLILGLNPVDALGDGPLDVADPEAVQRSLDWLAKAVAAWKTAPGLVAWGLQHDVEAHLASGPAALVGWLARRYGGKLDMLNAAWDTRFRSFAAIGPDAVEAAEAARPGGFGPGTLELARQREEVVSDTLSQWARAIRADDPVHPVLGGRMRRYRTLLSAPTALAGLQPFRRVAEG
ncbi:MAG: hypothetical protein HYU66_06575, partial [Armatimonadetes bacterium]|nr:hypothetical protein [Armatimonadota bacterium]